jgi:hypothetical protein
MVRNGFGGSCSTGEGRGEGITVQWRGTEQEQSSLCNRGDGDSKSGEDGGAYKMGPRDERKEAWRFDWVCFPWIRGEARGGGAWVVYGWGGALPRMDKEDESGWELAWGLATRWEVMVAT